MTDDSVRWAAAMAAVLLYLWLCAALWRRERQRQHAAAARAAELAHADADSPPMLVLHATQTGLAEQLAWETARGLHARGLGAQVLSLNALDAATLGAATRALFVASTYGEGDAPDGASHFVDQCMSQAPALGGLRYAVLALGDRSYDRFCGFGRRLDQWLAHCGATPEFERVEVDAGDPAALGRWRAQLGLAAQEAPAPDDRFAPWRLVQRRHLNPGSQGRPVFLLALQPAEGPLPAWESGDLVQLAMAHDPQRPRDYSIASIPADGALHLIVRQEQHADGTLGAASGLLTSTLSPGGTVALRLRPHTPFRLGENAARPLLLIGNGTGLAGLRSHLRARAAAGRHANWLVFGERQAAFDFLLEDELEAWQRDGVLQRLDMVFSRDGQALRGERQYVQHRLLQAADAVRDWLARDGAVYVCGSLQGMAGGVDAALRQIVGDAEVGQWLAAGRYRRDVY